MIMYALSWAVLKVWHSKFSLKYYYYNDIYLHERSATVELRLARLAASAGESFLFFFFFFFFFFSKTKNKNKKTKNKNSPV